MGSNLSTILNFEGHSLTFLESESGELLIRAADLASPMGITKSTLRNHLSALDPKDKVVLLTDTLGGRQKTTFVSRSGSLQVASRGDSAQCRRLNKALCDFVVEWMDGKHRGAPDVRPLLEEVARLGRAVVELTAEVAELKRPALRPIQHAAKRYGPRDLHLLTEVESARLQRDGFLTSAAYLMQTLGKRAPGPKSAGLTHRSISWCKRNGGEVRRYLQAGRVLTYLPKTVLAQVHGSACEEGQLLLVGSEVSDDA